MEQNLIIGKEAKILIEKVKNCVFQIKNKNRTGIGYSCHFNYKNENFFCLVVHSNIINEEFIKDNQIIEMSLKDDEEKINISLNDNRRIYSSTQYKTTIIEIKFKKDKISHFLELDENIFLEEAQNSLDEIFIVHYWENKKIISTGLLKKINNHEMQYFCYAESDSQGSPILNLLNYKVVGMHLESSKNFIDNIGILLKFPILEYINGINLITKRKNLINLLLDIKSYDVNQEIYFLYNNTYFGIEENKVMNNNYNLKQLNDSNIELYINEKKFKYNNYFVPEKEGFYNIRLEFKIAIKDCSFMFCKCKNLVSIDLFDFDTSEVVNMSYMFYFCTNLRGLNLSNCNTDNVVNMNNMFCNCNNLINLDLSSFNTSNVLYMNSLFYNCTNLKNIELSSFNTSKVKNMCCMFYNCLNLKEINLSSFDIKNVENISGMFYHCSNLLKLDLSSFDTTNITDISNVFYYCSNLNDIDLSKFNTSKVTNMSFMFYNCSNLVELDLSSFDIEKATNLESMFSNCYNLKVIDLSSFNISKIRSLNNMFYNCVNLSSVKVNKNSYKALENKMEFSNKEIFYV